MKGEASFLEKCARGTRRGFLYLGRAEKPSTSSLLPGRRSAQLTQLTEKSIRGQRERPARVFFTRKDRKGLD